MSTSLTINLKRASKVYHEGDTIAGVVVVESSGETRHEGLLLQLEGGVSLQLGAKHTGLLDAFSNNIKSLNVTKALNVVSYFKKPNPENTTDFPITLISSQIELASAGKIPGGTTEIPFEIPLMPRASAAAGRALLETYHGVFVNIMYSLKATMKRSFLNKPLNTSCQFFVQYKQQESPPLKPVRCAITPASVRGGGGGGGHMPNFQIYAEIDSTVCALDKPITGLIRVDECSVPIKSIELQLVRVETCGCADGYTRDATEIQNIQVGYGDVVLSRPVPLYMVLPRLFTCPTTTTNTFKIEFELNIAVIFEDDYLVTENFPILLVRSR